MAKMVWYRRYWQRVQYYFQNWPIIFVPTMLCIGLLARIWYLKEYRYKELHRLYKKHQPIPLFIKDRGDATDIGWCDCGVPMEAERGVWEETEGKSWWKQTVFLGLCVVGRTLLLLGAEDKGGKHA